MKPYTWSTFFAFGVVFLASTLVYAESKQELSLLPTFKAPLLLPVNGVATAQFWVTNNTQTPTLLIMVPIKGVSQDTTGTNACDSPFSLKVGESCLLNLQIKGSQLDKKLIYGPLVCKTKGPNDLRPGTLCAQPAPEDSLNITLIAAEKAALSVEPAALVINAGNATEGILTVTNNSQTISANKIRAKLPHAWKDVTQDASDCMQVAPGASCKLSFTAGTKRHTPVSISISGSNTTQITSTIMVDEPEVKQLEVPN